MRISESPAMALLECFIIKIKGVLTLELCEICELSSFRVFGREDACILLTQYVIMK